MEEQDTFRAWMRETLTDMRSDISDVKTQTTKTNGRVTRLEKTLLAAGAASLMYLAIKAPELFNVIKVII